MLDNGTRQELSHFSARPDPVRLAVVLDATGMSSDTVEGLLAALRKSRLVTERATEISFLAFNDKASVSLGFVGTGDHVLPELTFVDADVPMSLRVALARAEEGLRSVSGARTLVLLLTGGGSSVGPARITNGVEGGRAELYAVFPGAPDLYRGRSAVGQSGNVDWPWWRAYSFETVDRNLNRRAAASLARRSGGRSLYALSDSEHSRVELFDQIGDEVASQYSIGFYPMPNDAGWHRVVVRLAPKAMGKGLSVSHRLGYRIAPAADAIVPNAR